MKRKREYSESEEHGLCGICGQHYFTRYSAHWYICDDPECYRITQAFKREDWAQEATATTQD